MTANSLAFAFTASLIAKGLALIGAAIVRALA